MRRQFAASVCALLVCVAVLPVAGAAAGGSDDPAEPTRSAAVRQADCSFPVTETDATGTRVTVSAEPERVVSLAPSAAQTMWEIGGKEKVVGISQYGTYLEGAGSRTNVSGAGSGYANVEKVVGTEPDLVLAPNVVSNDTVEKLRETGLTVYKFGPATSVESVVRKTLLVGRLAGECDGAERVAERMRTDLRTIREAVEGEDRPRVIYVFFGFTAGSNTFIDEIITTAGGRNVAGEAGIRGYRQISPETVVERNPEWILLNEDDDTVPRTDAFNSTTAVREGNVVILNRSYISQPAPRIMRPIRKLARTLHPEAYAAANATATPTPTPADATPTPSESGTTETSTPANDASDGAAAGTTATDGGGPDSSIGAPGFGPLAAVLALLGVALLARRR